MAFPALANTTAFPFLSSTASVAAVIPAMRARLNCRLYDSAKIQIDPDHHQEPNAYNNAYQNPLDLRVEGEDCKYGNITPEKQRQHHTPSISENATYFGSVSVFGCSDFVYIWGSVDHKPKPRMNHSAALGCNMTYEVVGVDATFTGTDIAFDPQNPPQPIEDTARRWPMRTSPRSILWADLGDPAANARVADAIKHHHGIIVAQHIATQLVQTNKTNNTTLAALAGVHPPAQPDQAITNAGRLYNATVTDPSGRRRVVQDATATRILEALLAAALVLLAVGWVTLPRTDVLPRSNLASIASMAALIAGGDLLSRVPPDAQRRRSEQEIAAALRGGPGLRLWMGWEPAQDENERLNDDGDEVGPRRFGIFVLDEVEDNERAAESAGSGGSVVSVLSSGYRGIVAED
ncbi:hypothetical protein PG991_012075 [Apiospora marii]|uniref:Uncharacterized protein n=2 Tax=Apiospora marii TaxID=335849 RepID=A0ABR1RFZ7_9PEZI